MKYFGADRFVYSQNQKIDYIIDNLYSKSFIYIKPNEKGGSTTMWELAHMGRKTVSKNQGNIPNVLNFNDMESIIKIIKNEEKKIGTIQLEVVEQTKNCMVNDKDWLNVKFWVK
jgi:glutamate-1-semialdehyde aminotransferase